MGKPTAGLISLLILLCMTVPVGAQEVKDVGDPDDFTEFEDPFAGKGEGVEVRDPLEPINRGLFWFNDKLYFYALKPVARVYRRVPEPGRQAVDNFFVNLSAPVRLVNNALQLKWGAAGNELRRFLFNSTLGVLGFFDPAGGRGWTLAEEDLGQTFGSYGVGHGFYLVLPLFGPSNLRDGVGRVGDYFLDPLPYVIDGSWELTGVKAYDRVNALSLDDDTYEKIKEDALDTYLFVRDAYMQRRQALIQK